MAIILQRFYCRSHDTRLSFLYHKKLELHLTLIPSLFFLENVVCFLHLLHIQVNFKFRLFMEANNMNPWEQSDLGPYCLQYRLPKNISRWGADNISCDIKKSVP